MNLRLNDLKELFYMPEVVLFEGVLYERLFIHKDKRKPGEPIHKYRKILNVDDYDYVTSKTLKARLDRFYKSVGR